MNQVGFTCEITALATGQNIERLREQVSIFRPKAVFIDSYKHSPDIIREFEDQQIEWNSLETLATREDIDVLIVASTGLVSLKPVIEALKMGKKVALANKESLVVGGQAVRDALAIGQDLGAELLPIDSEHSAVWQCLWGEDNDAIKELILTASGGAFRDYKPTELAGVTAQEALKHPTWMMGQKVTIDSATLFNKGLEAVEARWLFNIPIEKIKILQHKESIVHSMVAFQDGSIKAQLGEPDMRLPIQIAITHPKRAANEPSVPLDLAKHGSLNFSEVNHEMYPALQVALEAGRREDTAMAAVAGADEAAVALFLSGKIPFTDIPKLLRYTLDNHPGTPQPTLDDSLKAEEWGRNFVSISHANQSYAH